MKTIILLSTMLFLFALSNAQIVVIPDTAFLHALIDEGVDTNSDSLISFAEAKAITSLNFGENTNLHDLTGIEEFVNLDTLIVISINIETIDISRLKVLRYLQTGVNSIRPYASGIKVLDATSNTKLEEIHCHFNQISSINVSSCTNLKVLDLGCNNPLRHLNISNNIYLKELDLHFNENLYEVCVWTEDFPPPGLGIDYDHSPNVYFTTECTEVASADLGLSLYNFKIYPNPAKEIIFVKTGFVISAKIEIYNVNGKTILNKELNSCSESIDISALSRGLYIAKISTDENIYLTKIALK